MSELISSSIQENTEMNSELVLPPGFRFHPTDEELVVDYLLPQVSGRRFPFELVIKEINLYKYDPWVLPSKAVAMMGGGEKDWYFFSPRDKKYPNGSRPNRTAGSGYWKATGTDKVICTSLQGTGTVTETKVGIKKALVFYVGKAPKGTKTNWIMHEYRLFSSPRKPSTDKLLDDWVLCRIYKKTSSADKLVHEAMVTNQSLQTSSSSLSTNSVSNSVALDSSSSEFNDHFFPLLETNNNNNNSNQDEVKSSLRRLTSVGFNWGEYRILPEGAALTGGGGGGGNSCGVNEICVVPSVSITQGTSSGSFQEMEGGMGLWDPISLNNCSMQNDHDHGNNGFGL